MIQVLVFAVVFTTIMTCRADVVVMKNGDTHEAEVVSFDGTKLEATLPNGKVILDQSEVESIHFGITQSEFDSKRSSRSEVATKSNSDTRDSRDDLIAFGKPGTIEYIRIRVRVAKIERPAVRTLVGSVQYGNDECLVLVIDVENLDDRRIIQFNENFFSPLSTLHDDVENKILRVNYGLGNEIVGALAAPEDIDPGKKKSHVEVFRKPPPKTKSLIYTFDLKAFQAEGQLKFLIPAEDIRGFQAS